MGQKHGHEFAQEFGSIVQILDLCFGDDADEGVEHGIHDDTFDV